MGDFYYIIDEGKCEIFVAAVGKVLDVKEGDAFGELALMYDAPRAATVVAASEVQTWALDQMTFKKTLKDTTIKKRTMLQDFLKDVPILRLLSEYERLTLTDALQECTYGAGEVIMREGDEGETFCIIESGEVKCTKAGIVGEVCPRLKKGKSHFFLCILFRYQSWSLSSPTHHHHHSDSCTIIISLRHCSWSMAPTPLRCCHYR